MTAMRRVVAPLAVLLVAVVGLGAPLGAQDEPPPTDTADEGRDDQPEVVIGLVEQTLWLDPDGEIVVRFLVDDLPDDATVEVTLHERIANTADFDATLDRSQLRGRLTDPPLVLGTAPELEQNGSGVVTLRLPIRSGPPVPGEERLGIADAGVHPVDIAVYDTDRQVVGNLVTHVVRPPLDEPDDPIGVVVVAPLHADPSHRADGEIRVDDHTRAVWTGAVASLGSAWDLPLVVAARPEAIDALDAGGGTLDSRLVDDLAALVDAAAVPTMPYVDVDLDGLARAGLAAEIDRQLALGAEVLERELNARPDPTLFVADRALTTTDLDLLVERGIERVLVHHGLLADADAEHGRSIELTASGDTNVAAIRTDASLQAHQGSTGDHRLDATRLLADLSVDWFHGGDDGAAVVFLEADGLDPVFVTALAAGLDGSPLLRPVDVNDAFGAREGDGDGADDDPPTRHLVRDQTDTDLSRLRRDLDLTRMGVVTVEGVFPASPDITDGVEARLAVLSSRSLDESTRSDYFVTIAAEMDALLAGLGLPERRAITLPARDGSLPLTLTNDTGRPAVVAIQLDSDKLEIPDGDRLEIELPEGVHTIDVPVRARTSGVFPLEIVVESPNGQLELASARYTIRSAAVSGVGVAISVAAVLVLGVWWIRTARRARAAHAEAASA